MKRVASGLILLACILMTTQSWSQISTFPYFEDFDGFTTCGTGCGTACVLPTGAPNGWVNALDDDADWTVDAGTTPSFGTGPSDDHGGGGNFLYTEASVPCDNNTHHLESPVFDLTTVAFPTVTFWYHMFGDQMGMMHFDVHDGTSWNLDVVAPWTDNINLWQLVTIDKELCQFGGLSNVKFRIRATPGSGFESDMAIDDFGIDDVPPSALQYDGSAAIDGQEYTIVPITQGPLGFDAVGENVGNDDLTSAQLTVSATPPVGSPQVFQTPIANLPICDEIAISDNYNLTETGLWTVIATFSDPSDLDGSNDQDGYQQRVDNVVYARDSGAHVNAVGWVAGVAGINGIVFEIKNTASIEGVQVTLGSDFFTAYPPAGAEIRAQLWTMSGGVPDQLIDESAVFTVSASNAAAEETHDLNFLSNGTLATPGDYMVAIQEVSQTGLVWIPTTADIYRGDKQFSSNDNGATWSSFDGFYAPGQVPMIRMNLGCVAVDPGADATLCAGDSVQLGGAPTASGGSGSYTYSWAPAAGLSSTTIANPWAQPAATTDYTVTVDDGTGCVETSVVTVTVNPVPNTAFIGLSSDKCVDDNADTITVFPIGGTFTGPGMAFIAPGSWEFVPASAGPGSHWIKYCYTNSFGCEDCDSQMVVVHDLPDASIASPGPLCLNATPVNLVPATLFGNFWGPGITDMLTGEFTPAAAGVGTHRVYYEVVDGFGCYNIDSLDIVVWDIPTADAGHNRSICHGDVITIGGLPTAIAGVSTPVISTYVWSPSTDLTNATVSNPDANPTANITYEVVVTDANGCWDSDTIRVSINANPVANAGPDRQVCSGSSVQVGGSPTASGGKAPYSFVWTPSASLTGAAGPNPFAAPAGPQETYNVAITDANGCKASDDVIVFVNNNPVALAGSDKQVCTGSPVVIGATPAAQGGIAPYTYSWDPVAGLSSATAANPMADPAATTTYTLTVTDAKGCSGTDDVKVTVAPAVVVNAGADKNICVGDDVSLGGAPSADLGTPNYTYKWLPSTALSNVAASNPVASPTVSTEYTLNVTDAKGCQGSDVVLVTVNKVPTADAGDDAATCRNTPFRLGGDPSAFGGKGPYTYAWAPSGSLSDATVPAPLATPTVTTVYTLVIVDANGCSDDAVVEIDVNDLPVVSAGPDKHICSGETVRIGGSPTAKGGEPAYKYNWTPGSLSDASDPNPTTIPLGQGNAPYTVVVTDANGCTNSDVMTVIVHAKPVPVIDSMGKFCVNDSAVLLTATPAGGTFTGAGVIASSFHPELAGVGAHPIKYRYTNQWGCTGEGTLVIPVHQLPVIEHYVYEHDIYLGRSLDLSLDVRPGAGTSVTWTPTDGVSDPNSAQVTLNPIATTDYVVGLETEHGCKSAYGIRVNVDNATPITVPNTITPNGDGSNDTWRITDLDFYASNVVQVFNRWGQLVHEQADYNAATEWDGGDLPHGTYFWVIKTTHSSGLKKTHRGHLTIIR